MGREKPKATPKKQELAINENSRNTLIVRFKKVNDAMIANLKRDTWKIAHTARTVTADKNFKKAFKNDKDFAEAVGYTPGAMSKLIACANMDEKYKLNDEYGLTTGQAQELIPLFRLEYEDTDSVNYLEQFLSTNKDTLKTTTTKDIRKGVNDIMLALSDSDDMDDESDGNQNDESDGNQNDEPENEQANDDLLKSDTEILNAIIALFYHEEHEQETPRYIETYNAVLAILKEEELI